MHSPSRDTAVWLNMLEPIFFRKDERDGALIVVIDRTPAADYARKHYRAEELLFVSSTRSLQCPTFDELLTETDLVERLKDRSVKFLAVPYRTKKEYRAWSRANHITLITPSASSQGRLENKRVFQGLLTDNGVRTPNVLHARSSIRPGKTYVVQKSTGSGMQGTKFHNAEEMKDVRFTRSTLVREYVEGIPIGTSIIIDRVGNAIYSAIRRQCFEYAGGFPKTFLGIQWLPTNLFSTQVIDSIHRELARVCSLLQKASFAGMANIDMIVSEDQAYVLECNPRLSAATPQLFSRPGLASHQRPWTLYVHACGRKPFGTNDCRAHIPDSTYEGATLDIDVPAFTDVSHIPPIGTYRITRNGITLVEPEQQDPKDADTFFLFHELSQPHARIKEPFTLASIFSDIPLYDRVTGTLNTRGSNVREAVCSLFGYHPSHHE